VTANKEAAAEQYFLSGLNCAQSVFMAFADEFGFDESTAAKFRVGLAAASDGCAKRAVR
jgi:hypothetical protein